MLRGVIGGLGLGNAGSLLPLTLFSDAVCRSSARYGCYLLFPGVPEAVAVAGQLGGALVATMKAPIFSALFVMVMVQHETSPVIAIAGVAGALATARLPIRSSQSV